MVIVIGQDGKASVSEFVLNILNGNMKIEAGHKFYDRDTEGEPLRPLHRRSEAFRAAIDLVLNELLTETGFKNDDGTAVKKADVREISESIKTKEDDAAAEALAEKEAAEAAEAEAAKPDIDDDDDADPEADEL